MDWISREQHLEGILDLFSRHTGITLDRSNWSRVRQDIEQTMIELGVSDPGVYRRRLEVDAEALDSLVSKLVVGETYFFREYRQFEQIENVVLPDLRRRFGDNHMFRSWCAGCASGEEPFSLAILFDEVGLAHQSLVIATDISRSALTKAHRATFGSWSLRGDGAARAWPYLERRGNRYRLRRDIVERILFRYGNLVLDGIPSVSSGLWGFDLILCRNVMIYFDVNTVAAVAKKLYNSLAEGGWLITGATDPPLMQHAPFDTVVNEQGVFYRRPTQSTLSRLAVTTVPRREESTPSVEVPAWIGRVRTDLARKAAAPVTGSSLPKPVRKPNRVAAPDRVSSALPPAVAGSSNGALDKAREALKSGDYVTAAELSQQAGSHADAWALRVRALANADVVIAEKACREATEAHRISPELHHLHATLLLALGRDHEAEQAIRRVLFLDSSLAIGHVTLGAILRRRGDLDGARRCFRNAHELASAMPGEEIVPLSDGERASQIAEAALAEMAILSELIESTP